MSWRLVGALALLAGAACADRAELGVESEAIIGGGATSAYPSVVQIESTSGLCTGVPDEEGGCGCRTGGDDRSASAALLLLALLLVRRKRR